MEIIVLYKDLLKNGQKNNCSKQYCGSGMIYSGSNACYLFIFGNSTNYSPTVPVLQSRIFIYS